MTWTEGRKLANLTTGGKTWTYTNDHNGQRTKKVCSDGTATYYYLSAGQNLGEDSYDGCGNFLHGFRYTYNDKGVITGYEYGPPL